MFKQAIEYIDVEVTLPPPIKKQVWDEETQTFIPMTLYKRNGIPNHDELDWLQATYGRQGVYKNGRYWDYSRAANFIVMDEKVYTWYSMKWMNK